MKGSLENLLDCGFATFVPGGPTKFCVPLEQQKMLVFEKARRPTVAGRNQNPPTWGGFRFGPTLGFRLLRRGGSARL